jgi:integrase
VSEKKRRRGAKGGGSILKLKGCQFWYVSFYTHEGRKVRMSSRTTVKAEAAAFLREELKKRDAGQVSLATVRKTTYADLRGGLLANYNEKGNRSLVTRADGTETVMGLPQLDKFAGFTAADPGPSAISLNTDFARRFIQARRAERAGTAVINRSLACLRRMLKIAFEEGKLSSVPVIRLLKEPSARRGFITETQFEALLKVIPSHLRPLLLLLFYCGVRLGEALDIEWSDVDLDARLIRLHRTKNDEPRTVPMPSELVAILREREPKSGPVFEATNLRKEWRDACSVVGLGIKIEVEGKPHDPKYKGLTVHDLRRSAARNLRLAGISETVAMKIGGWKTESVFRRCNIVAEDDLTDAMNRRELALLRENDRQEIRSKVGQKSHRSPRKQLMALSSRG